MLAQKMELPVDREFWVNYLGEGTDYISCQSLKEDPAIFTRDYDTPYKRTFGLKFAHGYEILGSYEWGYHEITLRNGSDVSQQLGWMDCQHMSDAFRFDEYELIVESANPQSWMVRALLFHYVAPMPDELDALISEMEQVLEASELFTPPEIACIANWPRKVARRDFRWYQDQDNGLMADGDYCYALRNPRNTEFNYGLWNAFKSGLTRDGANKSLDTKT